MTLTTIKIKKSRKDKSPLEFVYNFQEDTQAMRLTFGESTVHAAALATFRQQLIDHCRRLLSKKKNPPTPQQVQDSLADWKPGARRRGVSALSKAEKLLASMSPDQRAELAELAQKFTPPSTVTNAPDED